jgi:hypothetical protein
MEYFWTLKYQTKCLCILSNAFSALRPRNLEAHQNHHTSTASSRQKVHPQNTENILAGPDIKPRTVGESQANAN